jgi:hypothetical protein
LQLSRDFSSIARPSGYTPTMLLALMMVFAAAVLAQPPQKPLDVTLMKAALGGSCSADFTVTDAGGKPIVGATVHVKLRYGFAGVKRADLEIETSPAGKVRIEGLPEKAKPMTYEIRKDELKAEVTQDVSRTCHATFDVTLK